MNTILVVVQTILAIVILVSIMMQPSKADALSGLIQGSQDSFFSRNKGRTREGMLKKWTIISGIAFVIVTIALSIIYIA